MILGEVLQLLETSEVVLVSEVVNSCKLAGLLLLWRRCAKCLVYYLVHCTHVTKLAIIIHIKFEDFFLVKNK